MQIKQNYKYKLNEIIYVSENIPENAEILETINILCADEGKILIKKATEKEMGTSIWLKDDDIQDNYIEIIKPVEIPKKKIKSIE